VKNPHIVEVGFIGPLSKAGFINETSREKKMFELYSLVILMILGSLVAIHTKYLLSAVISLTLVGLILCVVFLYLQAPDTAITQTIVEVIALVILIRAVPIKKDTMGIKGAKETFSAIVTTIFLVLFAFFAYKALLDLPQFGFPLMRVSEDYVREGLAKTGSANIVTAVLLDFRAYDTLGEATVLFTAILGAIVVLRKVGRK